jgi:hypothetical protein
MTYAASRSKNSFYNSGDEGSSSDEEVQTVTEAQLQEQDTESARVEFKKVFNYWVNYTVDWHSVYNDKGLPEELDLIRDMMGLDIGVLYQILSQIPSVACSH